MILLRAGNGWVLQIALDFSIFQYQKQRPFQYHQEYEHVIGFDHESIYM